MVAEAWRILLIHRARLEDFNPAGWSSNLRGFPLPMSFFCAFFVGFSCISPYKAPQSLVNRILTPEWQECGNMYFEKGLIWA
jgi:hypothetical protein